MQGANYARGPCMQGAKYVGGDLCGNHRYFPPFLESTLSCLQKKGFFLFATEKSGFFLISFFFWANKKWVQLSFAKLGEKLGCVGGPDWPKKEPTLGPLYFLPCKILGERRICIAVLLSSDLCI